MHLNKKIIFGVLCILLTLIAYESTFAYYVSSDSIDNHLYSSEAKIYINEKFNPNDKWLPGEEKIKEVRFGNEGMIDAVLRVRFTPRVTLENGKIDQTTTSQFTLNFDENFEQDWERHGEWYYYKKILAASQETDRTLVSVTMSSMIGNDEHKMVTDYSNSSFEVEIQGELLQASLASETAEFKAWEWIPHISGEQVIWEPY